MYTIQAHNMEKAMLLSEYKKRYNKNVQDLAYEFRVTHKTMYSWIKNGYTISGRKGKRVISMSRDVAIEGKGKI